MYMMTWDEKKERKKDRHLRQMKKMKNELPQVGVEPMTLCTPDRCSCTCTNSLIDILYMYIVHVYCTCTLNDTVYMYNSITLQNVP